MGPLKRILRYLRALIMGKLDEWEDPEIIINDAVREMRENQIRNRELAVQAITQKNNLQSEVDKEQRLVADFERKATIALQSGNRELARQFLKERALHEQTLQTMVENLAKATDSAEKVKLAIRAEEERIRVKTAEALALKAKMKQAQIQIKINQALDQFQFSSNEQDWAHVNERVQAMESEANARSEIAAGSIDARLREVEVSQVDAEADAQLAELEKKLNMGGTPAARYTTTPIQTVQTLGGGAAPAPGNGTAPESDIDRQLRELEAKLGKK